MAPVERRGSPPVAPAAPRSAGSGGAGRPGDRGRASAPSRRPYVEAPRSRQRGKAEPRIQARDLGRKGPLTAFSHLARTQLWSVTGDALITASLATTVFFNSDPNAPREKVALYLLLTVAPFAVASPFIGPLLDRMSSGRRWMIFGAALGRALAAFLLIGDLENARFYLWAFLMLVLSKIHLISKSAVLPTTVRNDAELVEANSKLSLLGALAGVAGGLPGFILAKLVGPQITVGLALAAFLVTALEAFQLPINRVAEQDVGAAERSELQGAGIIRAAEAMSALRFVVGFLTFAILFDFRSAQVPNLWYGLVALAAQAGFLGGSSLAPSLRRRFTEEHLIMVGVGFACVAASLAALLTGLGPAALLAFAIGAAASVSKQGFDSLVQRDAPDANRGRSFARFESRFQVVWVIGAFIPVVIPIPQRLAAATIAFVCVFAALSYWAGHRQIRAAAAGLRPPIPPREPLHLRVYHLFRPPSHAPAEPDPGWQPVEYVPAGPLITGFLTDPDLELEPGPDGDPAVHETVDPEGFPPLAPSNPLVGGRWRSPEPEELFTTDGPLPMPPPEATPTGLFAPAVGAVVPLAAAPLPTIADEPAAPAEWPPVDPDPGDPTWFGSAFDTVDLTTAPSPLDPSAPPPTEPAAGPDPAPVAPVRPAVDPVGPAIEPVEPVGPAVEPVTSAIAEPWPPAPSWPEPSGSQPPPAERRAPEPSGPEPSWAEPTWGASSPAGPSDAGAGAAEPAWSTPDVAAPERSAPVDPPSSGSAIDDLSVVPSDPSAAELWVPGSRSAPPSPLAQPSLFDEPATDADLEHVLAVPDSDGARMTDDATTDDSTSGRTTVDGMPPARPEIIDGWESRQPRWRDD